MAASVTPHEAGREGEGGEGERQSYQIRLQKIDRESCSETQDSFFLIAKDKVVGK